MKTTFYIQFTTEWWQGHLQTIKAVRMTQKRPYATTPDTELIVKFTADLPESLITPAAEVTVEDGKRPIIWVSDEPPPDQEDE